MKNRHEMMRLIGNAVRGGDPEEMINALLLVTASIYSAQEKAACEPSQFVFMAQAAQAAMDRVLEGPASN
jgi:hypothetical protein